ncbi:gene transfer agent family protein [Tardiphaga sp. 367_B4_N1_1]|uniref:gene transfer agent family protein n=1 Tax=Tardiphaga sp. 367_B4_N1_1 TaxID=3240777 RepID=UPI003F295821
MSRNGACELVWAGDSRTFRLGIGELLALQDKLDAGPADIANRLRNGTWRVQDVQETFRISLIGAGEDPKKAKALVEEYICPGRILSHVMMAWAIIINAIQGDENDPVGKEEEAAPLTSETTVSAPQASTATARSSASRRKRSKT